MEHINIYKILGFSLEKNKLKEVYSKLEHKEGLTITSSGDINLEFNHPDAQRKELRLKS